MIANELEYKITKAEIAQFEQAIAALEADQPDTEAWMLDLQRSAMQSTLEELQAEVAEYEQLKGSASGSTPQVLKVSSFSDLPSALIRARIAKGWTQTQLAERLGVRTQQVQNDEATLYQSASFARLTRIAKTLEVEFERAELKVG